MYYSNVLEDIMVKRDTIKIKPKKPRKPMSEEQRKQVAERFAKARAEKLLKNPPSYSYIADNVLALPEDDVFSFKNVRRWQATQKEILKEDRSLLRKEPNTKGLYGKVSTTAGYIANLDRFLRTGDYCDDFYGEHREHAVKWRCVHPAYDKEGNIKRTHGVFYSDLGFTWNDMAENEVE